MKKYRVRLKERTVCEDGSITSVSTNLGEVEVATGGVRVWWNDLEADEDCEGCTGDEAPPEVPGVNTDRAMGSLPGVGPFVPGSLGPSASSEGA